MNEQSKRFRVALSFPGEHRAFLEDVAAHLATHLGRDRVLYDRYHAAEFARPDLDTYLQSLYHDESDLIVVFLSEDYERKEWCGLEWRAIRDLIKKRQAASVMLLRFDTTEIPGLFSIDGYISIGDQSAEATANLILERLGAPKAGSGQIALATSDQLPPQRIAPSRLHDKTTRLFGRETEMAALDAAWGNPVVHIVSLVAWGGVGKTALVARWRGALAADDFDGADYFDWSFYRQGTSEKGGPSADPFVDAALRFFGDTETADSTKAAWEKGSRLAALIAERKTLLILDGLEPLQYPPGPLAGQLKDPALQALLKGLAGHNPGLCLITTRERVADLSSFEESTASQWELERLSTEAGADLLAALPVLGPRAELETVVEEVRGHALTLNLLGRFLRDAHGGDVRRRDLVNFTEADAEIQGGHAFRVLEAYERWFASGGETGQRLLTILRLLGLFDRPATANCLEALRCPPAIPELTGPLTGASETQWNLSVSRLTECGLVLREDGNLDTHPLVREYFGRRLQEEHPTAWRTAHGRLFDHLKDTTEHQPDTLAGLQPLYQAVVHGCLAGREEEARAGVYRDRINRGTERDGFYSMLRLGSFGADLGAVACFFEVPWTRLSTRLGEDAQAWLLGQAAFCLHALGRLTEAIEPLRAGLSIAVEREDWTNAATGASNLSELELTLGDIAGAKRDAERSVDYADLSDNGVLRVGVRTTLADALHQAGRQDVALARFREAEAMQAEQQPRYPLLNALEGFRYCDLLLGETEHTAALGPRPPGAKDACHEVERQAARTLDWGLRAGISPLPIALNHLTLGRVWLYRSLLEATPPESAHAKVEQAVDGLRRAGQLQYLPLGLLTRAWLRSALGDTDRSHADLAEAEEIAERGPMPLHLADVHLYRARLFHDRASLKEVRRLVEEHGYGRRRKELDDLEVMAAGWLGHGVDASRFRNP